ncbi:hypothetical protein JTE90_010780 [Oedothorax gibbosus]|uniref:DDE Tnp4 domain-containing protein n=1 Tax=Oedothorax gibbosus TaxID=931172 RepID=A0AAV6TYJ3_9ARAC|nr:hypothetical protein JTE90_010780 [Oedothorax gibbosus]
MVSILTDSITPTPRTFDRNVEVPAFKRGKKQLSAIEIEETRGLASLRIHVERVIGVLRQKYRMLEGRMPISLVSHSSNQDENISTVDKIVTIAAALLNMCPPVIPYD